MSYLRKERRFFCTLLPELSSVEAFELLYEGPLAVEETPIIGPE